MTAAFDTLAYAKRLKEAGFTDAQAEGQALALADAFKEGVGELATKADLHALEAMLGARIDTLEERVKGRFTLLQWMLGFNLALSVGIFVKLFLS